MTLMYLEIFLREVSHEQRKAVSLNCPILLRDIDEVDLDPFVPVSGQ